MEWKEKGVTKGGEWRVEEEKGEKEDEGWKGREGENEGKWAGNEGGRGR